jgi:hypothetical protein
MARCSRCKCQNESVECRKFCQYHLDLFKKNAEIKRNKRRANNRCVDCNGVRDQEGRKKCKKCLEKHKKRFKERFVRHKQLGLCVICSNPKNNGRSSMCDECASNDKLRQKEKRIYCKKNKLCYKCYTPTRNDKILCLECSIENNIRKNIIYTLRKEQVPKSARTEEILGCKIVFFRDHIKNLMEHWMNADNYGVHVPGERRWQLGHRMPISAFDLSDPEQIKKAWHYTNIIPQEAEENIAFQDLLFVDGKLVRGRDLR